MQPDDRNAFCCSMLEVPATAMSTNSRSCQSFLPTQKESRVLGIKIPAAAVHACSLVFSILIYRCHTHSCRSLAAGLKDNSCALSLSCCGSLVQLAAEGAPCWHGARLLPTAVLEGDDDGCDIIARVTGLHHLPSMVCLRYELHHAEGCQGIGACNLPPDTTMRTAKSSWKNYWQSGLRIYLQAQAAVPAALSAENVKLSPGSRPPLH